MSFEEEYNKLRKKRKEEEEEIAPFISLTPALDLVESGMSSGETEATRWRTASPSSVSNFSAPTVPKATAKKEEKKGLFDGLLDPLDDGWDQGDITSIILGGADRLVNNDFTSWLGTSAMSGLASFNKGITSTADVLLGKPLQALGWENNPISSMADYYSDQYDIWKGDQKEAAEKLGGGEGWNFASEAIEGTVAAVPNMLAMMMSGGASAAPNAASLTNQAAMQAGNFLTKAGLTVETMMKNPQYWLSFARTLGTDYEEAKAEGASDLTAATSSMLSSLINSGIEIGIDGGSGVQGLAQDFANGNKNGFLAWVESAFEEGGEEVIQGFVNNAVAKVAYDEDRELANLGDMAKEFGMGATVGAVLGGGVKVAQGVTNAVTSAQADKAREEARHQLTANEQAVVDKEYADRLAEEEKNGKVSSKKKAEIYEEVLSDMEKGYISTDTIEEVLGGESYKTYKDSMDSGKALLDEQKALQEEFKTLNQLKQGEMTGEQIDRRAELKKQLEEIQAKIDDPNTKAQNDLLQAQLHQNVYEMTKGDRLRESYFERVRSSQKYEADLSQYQGKARDVIQKVMESGLADNSNQSHEFWDMAANLAAGRNIDISIATNEELMEMLKEEHKAKGKEFDESKFKGQIIDGYFNGKGIVLNAKTKRALNFVVGHEITHSLEGTEHYKSLRNLLFEYAKGEYETRYNQRAGQYANKFTDETFKEDVDKEVTADLVGDILFTDKDFIKHLTKDRNVFQKVWDEVKYLAKMATAGSDQARQLEKVKREFEKAWKEAGKAQGDTQFSVSDSDGNQLSVSEEQNENGLSEEQEVVYSISNDTPYANAAIEMNKKTKYVSDEVMQAQKTMRERVATRLREMVEKGVALPEDIEGNTAIANSSYDVTEENTTICPRSLSAEAFVDAVSEYLGRPLTVEEQIYISQDLQGRSLTPECTYCYVATDRKAYRAFLGEYINQRDAVIEKLSANPNADVSRSGELYKQFLGGRKDTNPMYNRFKMWVDTHKNGTPMIDASHLANMNRLMGDIASEFGAELKPQIVDAMKYAQSASWAKKRISYVAYNGHILKWKQDRINKLNSHYGLRMYSFSDFHPAFVLENMQMITDASVRGLKVLGYTKDTDFVEIFAPSGMNINVSTFGFESGGNVYENNIIGAEWAKAQELRAKHPNVGITFVATNDTLVEWALAQDWIDVVIPYHLVRTGAEVAKAFNYTNYTSESSDTKTKEWVKGDKKYIAPTEHNNDKATYLAALAKNHLKPRFERFIDNPNYMKLVNECRQSASESKPVQPVFNEDAAMTALAKLEANGYYQPIGGSVERMYEIAAQVAEDMTAPVQTSISDDGQTFKGKGWNVYAKDILLDKGISEDIAPVAEANPETEEAEELFPDAPMADLEDLKDEAQNLMSAIEAYEAVGDHTRVEQLLPEYEALMERIGQLQAAENARVDSLTDADVPPEVEAPIYRNSENADPFGQRNWDDVVGNKNRKVKAYMYEHPEVKPFFQEMAMVIQGDLGDSIKAERWYNDELHYESGGEKGFGGNSRLTSQQIATMLDEWNMTYADIEKGLNAIIEDNGAENISAAKKIEFMLNDMLHNGYKDFRTGKMVAPNQAYIDTLNELQANTYSKEAFDALMAEVGEVAPVAEKYETIRPIRPKQPKLIKTETVNTDSMKGVINGQETYITTEDKLNHRGVDAPVRPVRADSPNGKERKWVGTSTASEAVDGKVLPEDLDSELTHYQPISNKKTLGNANARLDNMGYETAVAYMNSQFANNKVTLDDIALGERLIQEAVKKGDYKTAGDLIMDISILGTELGQKVQALSIIKRLTPEGQLKMLEKTISRGKARGDKAFEGVEVTEDMIAEILKVYAPDGSFDTAKLHEAVERVKKMIADDMTVTKMEKVNAWRYLSMLGNPKTHIRNLVSNVAMKGTVAVKNALARTIEDIAPIKNRTKTWKSASDAVKAFAERKTIEMKDVISGDSKYSDSAGIKDKRAIFKNKILNGLYEFNSDMLGKEDWWFSKGAFQSSLSEFLTANGLQTEMDIKANPEIVEKGLNYALEQSQIATFRQYSWLANKINEIERKNNATQIAVGSILPFKKTPINIAKTGLNYSPLGFAKTLTYDISQVKKGNMEASEMIDHLAQNVTGTALTLVGAMLAQSGFLNGAGDDDKEGDYDYQLGKQGYSVNIGDATFSLSWLSPVAMPLFVGANMYEQLVEDKEWNGDVVVQTLAQTLDPLSEMSFLSSLDSVLSSYDSGIMKFAGIAQTGIQSYVGQFVPTLSSQIASTMDDTKRTTRVSADSGFKAFDETINSLMYKIPGLRNMLEPSTDIWGNEIKQTENVIGRAVESFLAPWSKRDDITTAIDEEIKDLYRQTGNTGLIPSIPANYVSYDGTKYEMSAKEFTEFKKNYGQTAFDLMEQLFDTDTYQNADSETRADMVSRVYDYARDEARKEYFAGQGIDYTNATKEGDEYFREDPIKGAIENDMPVDEYVFSTEYPEKYSFFRENGISYDAYASADEDGKRAYSWAYENPGKYTMSKAISDDFLTYYQYKTEANDFKADKDENGKTISGSKKEKVKNYIFGLDLDYGQKVILYRSMYDSKADRDEYNMDIIDYLNGREDITYEEMETILKELGFTVSSDGWVTWD